MFIGRRGCGTVSGVEVSALAVAKISSARVQRGLPYRLWFIGMMGLDGGAFVYDTVSKYLVSYKRVCLSILMFLLDSI